MTIVLPALPALMAGQALRSEAEVAARRTLDQIRRLLDSYDLVRSLLDEVPPAAREVLAAALGRRLAAAGQGADHCRQRLDEAAELCAAIRDVPSPVDPVEVSDPLFEMLSPFLDDAMEPVLADISRRAGPGCTPEDVRGLFPPARPAIPA